jgi:hypothetical protein
MDNKVLTANATIEAFVPSRSSGHHASGLGAAKPAAYFRDLQSSLVTVMRTSIRHRRRTESDPKAICVAKKQLMALLVLCPNT